MVKYTLTVEVDRDLSPEDQEALALMWRDGIEDWAKKGLSPAKSLEILSWEKTSAPN